MEEKLYKRKFIRLPKVLELTTLGKSTIYEMIQNGNFPRALKLGAPQKNTNAIDSRANFWIESEVISWLDSKIAERKKVLAQKPASSIDSEGIERGLV